MKKIKFNHSKNSDRSLKRLVILLVILLLMIGVAFGGYEVKNYVTRRAAVQRQNDPELQREKEQRDQEHQFIKKISDPAIQDYRKNYQVLPSVVIAQAIVESNWGASRLYQAANNPFGIKGSYHHKSVSYETAEYVHGRRVIIHASFRKYPTLSAAVMDHDNALNKGFIHRNHVMSYITDARLLQKNHYATDPNYANKLIKIIKAYHLNRYDLKALND